MNDSHFLLEPITVEWHEPMLLVRKPRCPDRFLWNDQWHEIVELLGEWRDYRRRGRMANNMRPEHAERASQRGSRGVGRFYFRVRDEQGALYELYFDRAAAGDDPARRGWFLSRALEKPDTG